MNINMSNISFNRRSSKLITENLEKPNLKLDTKDNCSCYSCYQAITKGKTDPCLKDEEIKELKAKNQKLTKEFEILRQNLVQIQLQMLPANSLRERSKMFLSVYLTRLMGNFTLFAKQIKSKQACLRNFVKMTQRRIQHETQIFISDLIVRQTIFLKKIIETQLKNNETLYEEAGKHFKQLSQEMKNMNIKSNFSQDLLAKDSKINQKVAAYHQKKNNFFTSFEQNVIEKVLNQRVLNIEVRNHGLFQLIYKGKQILNQIQQKFFGLSQWSQSDIQQVYDCSNQVSEENGQQYSSYLKKTKKSAQRKTSLKVIHEDW